jgi:hypothetical protein
MAALPNTTIASPQAPTQPADVIPFPRDYRDAIRAGRKLLPSHELTDVPVRKFVASVCQAEINHAVDDFWQVVDGINARGLFYGETGADAAFRFSHEARAGEALVWLSHLQGHDNDRHGPSLVRDFLERWNRWDRTRRAEWLQRRRYLVHGLIRAAAGYRAARASLA